MKKLLLIIITVMLYNVSLYSQTVDSLRCDAPDIDTTEAKLLPWYNNNDYLEDFLDSIGYDDAYRIVGVDRVRYHVPVKFWIYRSTAGAGVRWLASKRTMQNRKTGPADT